MSRSERITLSLLAAAALVLRAVAFFRYRFDSDEPQHLHVTWGWIAGYLQYRDVFDNHTPLFHIVTAPILKLVGERSDVLLFMRAPMLLLFAIVAGCTFVLARRHYTSAVGARAVVLLILLPHFFLKSLEYRNDNLWNTLWMLSLVAIPYPFLSGLLMGGALATSMKTAVLVVSVGIAAATLRTPINRKWIGRAAAGSLVIPALVAGYFAWRGALQPLFYWAVTFNGLRTRDEVWIARVIVTIIAVPFFLWLRRRQRASFPAVVLVAFIALIASFWILPFVSPRDFLPMMPLAAIVAAAGIERLRRRTALVAALGITFIVALYYYADRFEKRTDEYTTMLDQLLKVSRPGEPVVDFKGELVYRPRASFYVLETITRELLKRGTIPDTIQEDVIAARCYVAQADGEFWPPKAKGFLNANFLNLGRLRASGQWIRDDGSFSIAVPGPYLVIDENGMADGKLDGLMQTRSRTLAAGRHHFERTAPGKRAAVLWAPAFERGLSPFHPVIGISNTAVRLE